MAIYTKTLEEIGLSPNEAKIYEILLSAEERGVSEISLRTNIHRRNVYDALHRLIEKGLVFRKFQKNESRFRAIHPNKLTEVLLEKEIKLSRIMPDLTAMYDSVPEKEAAFIYKGIEGYKNYLRDLARVGEDTYFLGAKGLWHTPGVEKELFRDYQRIMEKKGRTTYTLYDPRIRGVLPVEPRLKGGKYKFLPENYITSGSTDVFGDHVVIFANVEIGNFTENGMIFVIVNPEVAKSYRTWFRCIWDTCPEVKPERKKK